MTISKNFIGFTLIELSVVLIIIGILLGSAYSMYESSVNSSRIVDTVAVAKDLSTAAIEYKSKYHSLPGDDPTASGSLPGLTALENGNGNGEIDTGELMLASKHLSIARLTKGGIGDLVTMAPFSSQFGRVWLISSALARTNNSPCDGGVAVNSDAPLSTARNVVLFERLPGDVAMALDQKLDDGFFNTGNIRGSSAYTNPIISCVASWIN